MPRPLGIRNLSLNKWRASTSSEDEIMPLLKLVSTNKSKTVSAVVEHQLYKIASQMGVLQEKLMTQEENRRKLLKAAMAESDRRFKEAEEIRHREEEERLARLREREAQLEIERKRREEERRLRSEADEVRRIEMSKEVTQRLEAQHDPEKEKEMMQLDAQEREQKDKLMEDYKRVAEEKQRSREEETKKAKADREALLASSTQSSWKDDEDVSFDDTTANDDMSWGKVPKSITKMFEQPTTATVVERPPIKEEVDISLHDDHSTDIIEETLPVFGSDKWEAAPSDTSTDIILGSVDFSIILEKSSDISVPTGTGNLRELEHVEKRVGRHRSNSESYSSLLGGSRKRRTVSQWLEELTSKDDINNVLKRVKFERVGIYDFFKQLVRRKTKLTDAQLSVVIRSTAAEQSGRSTWNSIAAEIFEHITILAKPRQGLSSYPLSLVSLFQFLVGNPELGEHYWGKIKDSDPPENVILAAVESISSVFTPPLFKGKSSGFKMSNPVKEAAQVSLAGSLFKLYLDHYFVMEEIDISDPIKRSGAGVKLHIQQLQRSTVNLMMGYIRQNRFTEVDDLWKAVRSMIGPTVRSIYLKRFVFDPEADPYQAKNHCMAIDENLRSDADFKLVIKAFASKGNAEAAEEIYDLRSDTSDHIKTLFLMEMVTAYEKSAIENGKDAAERVELFITGWISLFSRLKKLKDNKISLATSSFYKISLSVITRFYVGPADISHDESCVVSNRKLLELSDSIREINGFTGHEKRLPQKVCNYLLDLYIKAIDEDRANSLMGCIDIDNEPMHIKPIKKRLLLLYKARYFQTKRTQPAVEEEEPPIAPDSIPTPASA